MGFRLRLLDIAKPLAATLEDEVIVGSVLDEKTMLNAMKGVDMLLHLAGHSSERSWRAIMDLNIESTHVVLEAARTANVPVSILASSIHAVGFQAHTALEVREERPYPRPDTFYGLSKVVMEGMGSIYADRFGMRSVTVRIMSFEERPTTLRHLSTWLSPADFVRLVVAAHQGTWTGAKVVWGVSNNTRLTVSLEAGREIGYEPVDDAEDYAEEIAKKLCYASARSLLALDEPLGGDDFTGPYSQLGVSMIEPQAARKY